MSAIHEQAEYWFMRLQAEDCSAQERMAFQQWRTASPAHAAAYRRTAALWAEVGSVADDAGIRRLVAETLIETVPPAQRARHGAGWRKVVPALAASLMVVAAGWGAYGWWSEQGVHSTGLGERLVVALEDGSSMTLNTRTRVRVRYTEHERVLDLLAGEALFDVARDSLRPFRVRAGDGRVTALGTRFQVRREADDLRVVLLEGRVAFEQPHAAPVELLPGEQIRVADAQPAAPEVVDVEAAMSWMQGRMVFRATPLDEAVAEANRYARTRIRLGDPALAGMRISGTFVTGDSELLVAALEANMPLRADTSRRGEIVLRRLPN